MSAPTIPADEDRGFFARHLQKEARRPVFSANALLNPNHSDFDEIGCTALERAVEGDALRRRSISFVRRIDVWNASFPTPESGGMALIPSRLFEFLMHPLHLWIASKVAIEVVLSFAPGNLEFIGKAKCTHPIHNSKIDGLSSGPLLRGHKRCHHTEDFSRRGTMNVRA